MTIQYQDEQVTVHHGDCIEVMRSMPESSIDAIVTDPPYGLGFAGKKWDALPPGEDWARECLRVLKPGGHILAFGGSRTWHRLAVAIEDAGFEIRDSIAWMYGSGFPKHRTSLKPAFEPIVVARKAYKGTLSANELTHGTGAFSIDACRIPTEDDRSRMPGQNESGALHISGRYEPSESHPSGRWPSNVILDERTASALDKQSGITKSTGGLAPGVGGIFGWKGNESRANAGGLGDVGGASRFFYVAKAPRSERPNVDGIVHPTVKPLTLMRYLIKLVTPVGGTVLDTFAGSGTTLEAAILEGYKSIGIEQSAEYLPLIDVRIQRAKQ